jgi:VPDSG-CTERM motif
VAKIIVILAGAFLSIAARADTIVFDTFGPGDTYDPMHGVEIGGGGNMEEIAAQFSPSATGNLAKVTLGLTFFNGSNPAFRAVNVFLYGDASGSPDNADQTFLDSVTPTSLFDGVTNNSVVSFSVAGNVPVTAGSVYYLVLKPSSLGTADAWMVSFPAVSGSAFASFNDSTWAEGNAHTLPAFRLTVVSVVPDSSSTILLLLSSLGALLVLQTRKSF